MVAELGAGMQLENPRFSGVTETGETFSAQAARALPDGPVPDKVDLEAPRGEITLDNGVVVDARSERGQLSRRARTLELNGRVTITTSDGYRVETDRLILDFGQNGALSPGDIRGFGPAGSITAGSMVAVRQSAETGEPVEGDATDGARATTNIRFENGVRVVFIPSEAR